MARPLTLDDIVFRFSGVDIQYRVHGWPNQQRMTWRARLITNKNERALYRTTVYADTRQGVIEQLIDHVDKIDRGIYEAETSSIG